MSGTLSHKPPRMVGGDKSRHRWGLKPIIWTIRTRQKPEWFNLLLAVSEGYVTTFPIGRKRFQPSGSLRQRDTASRWKSCPDANAAGVYRQTGKWLY